MKNKKIIKLVTTTLSGTALILSLTTSALADNHPIKIGLMLPYTGTFAALGRAITDGFQLAINQHGGTLGGRDVEYVILDSEADPTRAPQNMSRLVNSDNVDFVVGPVHSGVAMGMLRVAQQTDATLIIPNAGLGAATNQLCGPNIFRTSFNMWQNSFPMGQVAYDQGHRKVVTITWDYAAGHEDLAGFEEAFIDAGGEIISQLLVPFPNTEFQPYLAQIANLRPDAVYTFFAGGGGVAFVRNYHDAGLMDTIPLLGSGFLTDGNLDALGSAAEGVMTTLHYSETLNTPVNQAFVQAYTEAFDNDVDTYAVQGYDAGMMLVMALDTLGGDISNKDALHATMSAVEMNSPRGPLTFSASNHPVQNIYLREVRNGMHEVMSIAYEALEVPDTDCLM